MKCYVLFLTLLVCINTSKGQNTIDKYTLVDVCIVHKDKEGGYLYQEKWESCNAIVVIDPQNKKITLNGSTQEIVFDILNTGDAVRDQEDNVYLKFACIRADGIRCKVVLITLSKLLDGFQSFLKIEMSKFDVLYRFVDPNK
jgi:hypothetical protein